MAATLKLTAAATAELDLSAYLNVQEGDGLDPADGGFLEPQFSQSAADVGQALVNIDTRNKEHVYPLQLSASSKDALHALVCTVRLKLSETGVRLEWRDDGATVSTFYDIEFGRFDPAYRYFRARSKWLTGVLRVWVRPFGHTATERIVGTAAGSGAMQIVSLASMGGDQSAQLIVDITCASTTRDIFGLSVVPSGAVTEWRTASLLAMGGDVASVITVGGSGAIGSQYRGICVGATAVGLFNIAGIQMASRIGNQRILAVMRTPNLQGVYVYANSAFVNGIGPTAFVSATSPFGITASAWQGWQLVDLGVIRPAPQATMQIANQTVTFRGRLASSTGATLLASPGLQVTAVYVVPEGRTSLVVDGTNGRSIPGRDRLDSTIGEAYGFNDQRPFTDGVRGSFQDVAPTGEQVAVFALGEASNAAVSAVVRVRERFSFQR